MRADARQTWNLRLLAETGSLLLNKIPTYRFDRIFD